MPSTTRIPISLARQLILNFKNLKKPLLDPTAHPTHGETVGVWFPKTTFDEIFLDPTVNGVRVYLAAYERPAVNGIPGIPDYEGRITVVLCQTVDDGAGNPIDLIEDETATPGYPAPPPGAGPDPVYDDGQICPPPAQCSGLTGGVYP